MTPLDALGLFGGIPLVIIAVVVGAVYGTRGRTPRSERAAELPPLTEPVLGSPDQPTRRLDRERREADARRAGSAAVAEGTSAGPAEQEKGDSAE